MAMEGLNQKETDNFNAQCLKTFKEQGQFFLNAMWSENGGDAENVWKFEKSCLEYDKSYYNALPENKKGDGPYTPNPNLDEFWSHKLLESYGKPMSVVEFRSEFKKIDLNFDKRMSLLELLIYWYKVPVKRIAQYVPGTSEEVEKAQKKLDEVAAAFQAAQEALDKAAAAEAEAKRAADAAKAAAAEAEKRANAAAQSAAEAKKRAEAAAESAAQAATKAADAAAAEAELKAALDDLKKQEEAYHTKTEELKQKSEGSGVAAMKAKNELAQHLGEDPLPLRKAKITTEAATKKAEKARVAADQAAKAADEARVAAEQAAAAAEEDKKLAEQAAADAKTTQLAAEDAAAQAEQDRVAAEGSVAAAERSLQEAQEALEEAKSKGGPTHGTFWWMERELQERKKYMPKSGKAKLNF
eukprot:TRINITY_DN4_c1_g1_i1.p1 TRINITY_DN4_c1_g1~~TRINITY_DN4_c1_g1_i1.p1  ORF type:complete len:413 (+),score=161.29 TRINITY_DN4_c1_g1_i1:48-1286(+)